MPSNLVAIFSQRQIAGVAFDSQKVKKGQVFVAIRGIKCDGNRFISQAVKAGAGLIISDAPPASHLELSDQIRHQIIYVENARKALSQAASIFYPELPKHLIAVTGTNGKTSVASYCQQLFNLLGQNSGNIGTLGVYCQPVIDNITNTADHLTTLDPVSFRKVLQLFARHHINHVAFEASSHGLDQDRLGDVKAGSAALTSFSHDHLDYHQNMTNYLECKLKLFSDNLLPGGLAVINSAIPAFAFIKRRLSQNSARIISVGASGALKIQVSDHSAAGQKISFEFNQQCYKFATGIIGSFQATNLLMAALLVSEAGYALADIVKLLPKVSAVRGRLERITGPDSLFEVFVDYAHTPEALSNSIHELQKIKLPGGRLIVIFGCGGDRDAAKRPLMGKIASQIADQVIITDDNPRTEDPSKIRQEIIYGSIMLGKHHQILEIADRRVAIAKAVAHLQTGDILLICGKGHENYQIVAEARLPFSDQAAARSAIEARGKS